MDPATLAVVGGAEGLSALAQLYQSQQAAKASKQRLDEIKQAFDALKPPGYNTSIMDPPDFIKTQVPEAAFDFSKMTPQQYALVGKYSPQSANLIAEKNPQLVQATAAGQAGRDAQMSALQKLKSIGSSSSDPELAQELQNAGQKAQIAAQSRSKSILQDAARRGEMGSGASLAAELQGSSDAMGTAAQNSSDAAVASYKNRLSALSQSGQLGGQVAQQDMQNQAANAGIINDFNARTAANAQNYENSRASMENDAQLKNLSAAQQVANQNVSQNNQQANADRTRQDQLLQYLQGVRQQNVDRQNNLTLATSEWNRGERNNQNNLAQSQYQDLFNQTGAAQGVAMNNNNQQNVFAGDKISAIGGLGNAAASAGMYSDSQDQAMKRAKIASPYEDSSDGSGDYQGDEEENQDGY